MKTPPTLYFSLRSPFSWMAIRRLDARMPQARHLVDWVPFFEPDRKTAAALRERGGELHYVPMSKAKHLYILADTKRLAKLFGYRMVWPVDVDPWWELPHLAWLKARQVGAHHQCYDALMAARWERGENICDQEVLCRILEEAGLDAAELAGAARQAQMRELGVRALMRVYENDVFGVPYFTVGRERFWGIDRLDLFIAALRAAVKGPRMLPEIKSSRAGGALTMAGIPRTTETTSAIVREAAPDSLAGVPDDIRQRVGCMDRDTAGGCG